MANILPFGKVLGILGVTATRFGRWKSKVAVCLAVPRSLCRKIYRNQLTPNELLAIKRGFEDPQYCHWPAVSIAWSLIKEGKVVANVQTITRYAKLLGLTDRRKLKKSRKRISITSTRPNGVWLGILSILVDEEHTLRSIRYAAGSSTSSPSMNRRPS